MGLNDVLIKFIGPAAIIGIVDTQDPVALAKDVAGVLDKILDDQFGEIKSERVQTVLVPFIDKFVKAFNEELLKDQRGK